jgi:hypothetical protein
MNEVMLRKRFDYWIKKFRISNHWDILLELIDDDAFNKTGDFRIDPDDKKAVILLNLRNPHHLNLEEVIVHELLHLKMYPLDQVTEGLIDAHYPKGSQAYDFAYGRFMLALEQTVSELTKCYLEEFGENKKLSYGRVKNTQGFNALYDNLKPYNMK